MARASWATAPKADMLPGSTDTTRFGAMDSPFDLGFDTFVDTGNGISPDNGFHASNTYSNDQMKPPQPMWSSVSAAAEWHAASTGLTQTLQNNDLGTGSFMQETGSLVPFSHTFAPASPGRDHFHHTENYYSDPVPDHANMDVDAGLDNSVDADSHLKLGTLRRHTDSTLASPAQSRRKAQNRAAQRAFRERKERHVRELETQLTALTEKATSLQCDNDRLVSLIQRVQAENKFLRSRGITSRPRSTSMTETSSMSSVTPQPTSSILSAKSSCNSSTTRSVTAPSTPRSPSDETDGPWTRCLDPAAAWDLLVGHPLFLKGAVDITRVCEKLGMLARCEDTSGPYFDEVDVRRVIEEVACIDDSSLP